MNMMRRNWRRAITALVVAVPLFVTPVAWGAVSGRAASTHEEKAAQAKPKPSPAVVREVEKFAPTVGTDGARRITLVSLRELMKEHDVIIVDARDPRSFEYAHAKGAINVPYGTVEKHVSELPHDKWIVTYCT